MRISDWSSDVCSSVLLPTARIAACPGCYPTAALLALQPLVEGHAVDASTISVFAMSGVSGAGRSLKEANLFPEVAEAVHPYGIGKHRHMPEIEQEITRYAGHPVRVGFTPHLVPSSEEHPSELQSLMRTSYAVFCLKQ